MSFLSILFSRCLSATISLRSNVMLMAGMIVRRKKRTRLLTVLHSSGKNVMCGWSENGKFYKRTFDESTLIILTPSPEIITVM